MTKSFSKSAFIFKNVFKVKIVYLFVLIFILHSCKEDDLLDQVNPNSLTTSSFWKDNNDLKLGLNSVYAVLQDQDVLGVQEEAKRTDIGASNSWRRNGNRNDLMYVLEYDQNTNYVTNKWNALYLGIFRANQVLENYERIKQGYDNESQTEEGVYIEAQARALRGYYYYVLNNHYNDGSVPLLDFIPKTFADFQQAFSTSQKVKDFYRADLTYGLENLPATYNAWNEVGSGNLGRITAGACEALLGKSYLLENNFTMAETYFKNVIDNYNYELVDDITTCTTGIAEFNLESIFEINYTTAINLNVTGEEQLTHRISHDLSNGNLTPSSRLNLLYRGDKLDDADPANINVGANVYDNNGNITGTEDRLRKYSLRVQDCMGVVDDPDSPFYGGTTAERGQSNNTGSKFARPKNAFFKKYTHWNTLDGKEDNSTEYNNKSDVNINVIRLAEVYLCYAECMLEKGDLSEALRYINRVRKRSHLILLGNVSDPGAEFQNLQTTYLDDIDMDMSNGDDPVTISNLMDHLRFIEIPLELSLEGTRVEDLRRWGVYEEVLDMLEAVQYDYWHYPANLNGRHTIRFKAFTVISGERPSFAEGTNPPGGPKPIDAQDAAKNRRSDNYYLPTPRTEIDANLNWDAIKDE